MSPPRVTNLADGEWHRLHPASPLLRGGLVLLAVLGFVIANLRERLVDMFLVIFAPDVGDDIDVEFETWRGDWQNDPIGGIVTQGLVGWAIAGVALLIVALIIGFWLSWRMHTFRITHEAVEVRSGILFRSHRSARLDRIQGINVTRPLFARLFGTAKLEVSVAGQSANVQLVVPRVRAGRRAARRHPAPGLRRARREGGPGRRCNGCRGCRRRGNGAPGAPGAAGSPAHPRRTARLPPTGPPSRRSSDTASTSSSRRSSTRRSPRPSRWCTCRSAVSSGRPCSADRRSGRSCSSRSSPWASRRASSGSCSRFVPAAIGLVSYVWSRITKSLRYSIAGTPDGVRIGHGLLSTGNQTIPPGRIHAIEATQWLLWRPFGWWSIRIDVAGQSVSSSNEAAQRTLVLPVGTVGDVHRVLALLLPDAATAVDPFVDAGLTGRDGAGGFSRTPRRAAWLRPFSWRRIGWAGVDGIALLRRGWLLRSLTFVPLARMQSVAVTVGPVQRLLDLASVRIHTVAGPVVATLPVADRTEAGELFERLADEAVERAASDTSHRWGAVAGAVGSEAADAR